MKKLFAIVALTAFMTSCNEADTKAAAEADSLRAANTADSLARITADSSMRAMDTTTVKMDTSMKSMAPAKDTVKK